MIATILIEHQVLGLTHTAKDIKETLSYLIDKGYEVSIDLKNVETMTLTFCLELFEKLAEEIGKDKLEEKLSLENVQSFPEMMISRTGLKIIKSRC